MNSVETAGNRSVAFTARETTTVDAAKLMRQGHVGSLVVVESDGHGRRMPVGIVTVDDVLERLSKEFSEVSRIVTRGQLREAAAGR